MILGTIFRNADCWCSIAVMIAPNQEKEQHGPFSTRSIELRRIVATGDFVIE
jgi:hypothetical protein